MRSTSIVLCCVAMLAAAVAAHLLTPHKSMARTPEVFDVDKHFPYAFGEWSPLSGADAVQPPAPTEPGRQIYDQEVSRAYVDREGHVVMLLVAYGESRSDRLQLHRPEVCYTAQGFRVSRTAGSKLLYSPDAPPVALSRLVARREERLEPISYWMRVGYDVSNSDWARQALTLQYGLRGFVADGALFRVSTIGTPEDLSFRIQDKFIRDLIAAVTPETRTFMVGDPAKALLGSWAARSRFGGFDARRASPSLARADRPRARFLNGLTAILGG